MIERYEDPAIRQIFGEGATTRRWKMIEIDYLHARRKAGDKSVTLKLTNEASNTPLPLASTLVATERMLGHDVVSFLAAWTEDMSPQLASQIHRGLTSSDLVDNTLFGQLEEVRVHFLRGLGELANRLLDIRDKHRDVTRAGRTHGQLAEPTTVAHRFEVWARTCSELFDQGVDLKRTVNVWKTPGAVGTARLLGTSVGELAAAMNQRTLVDSTQVIPRQRLVAWAAWLVQIASLIEEIALEIRLSSRSEVAEMNEGLAPHRIGSSAMPHKQNPIQSERLSGLGRVARGYFVSIAETAGNLHHERDISNSSVERIVVPDLAHLIGFMLAEITSMLKALEINVKEIRFKVAYGLKDSAKTQFKLQEMGLPYMVALNETRHWSEVGGWEYDRVLALLNKARAEIGLPEFNDSGEFLKALGI